MVDWRYSGKIVICHSQWTSAKHHLRLQQTTQGLSIDAVKNYGIGLMGDTSISLTIDKWGLSLPYIKAGAVPIIALPVWMVIRKVKEALTTAFQFNI